METIRATPSPEQTGQRLDKAAAELFGLSRSSIQELLSGGRVLVNGKPEGKSYRLRPEDTVEAFLPDPVACEAVPQDIPLDIVYEDDDLLVVNKPKGMVVHPAAGHWEGRWSTRCSVTAGLPSPGSTVSASGNRAPHRQGYQWPADRGQKRPSAPGTGSANQGAQLHPYL